MRKIYISLLAMSSIVIGAQNTLNTKIHEINFGNSSDPGQFIQFNNNVIFPATRYADEGRELWSFNPVTQKSSLLKNVFPAYGAGMSGSLNFMKINNKLYFVAQQDNSSSTNQLWVTDGTTAGTSKVKDLNFSYASEQIVASGNTIFFYNHNELWGYNITSDSLQLLKTFQYSGNVKMYSVNNTLFLAANDGVSGKQIWKSDGTVGGTSLLKDTATDAGLSIDGEFKMITLQNKFYCIVNMGTAGYELYSSDGTDAGTVSVMSVKVPRLEGAATDSYFVFMGYDTTNGSEPWVSDGTAAGTKLLKNIMPGATGSMAMNKFVSFNNKIFFECGNNGISTAYGNYIWETDGTEAGTVLFNTHADALIYGKSSEGKHLILTMANYGTRYWVTNGNSSQNFEITGLGMPYNNSFLDLNSKIYLTANHQKNGTELFSINPVTQQSALASDISRFESASPHAFEVVNNELIFIAKDRQYSDQIYKRNKTTQEIERLSTFGGNSYFGMYTGFDDKLTKVGNYLYTDGATHRTDGTAANSIEIASPDITSRITYASLNDNILLFAGYNNLVGTELWKVDNASNTATLVKDISSDYMGSLYSVDKKTAVLNGYAYFLAKENGKLGIWKTDGSEANTTKAIQFTYQDGTDGDLKVLNAANNKLFFTKKIENIQGSGQDELWSSDGDQASSILLNSYSAPYPSANISRETGILNNKLFYVTSGFPSALHSTDGTVAGTVEITTGNFGPDITFKKCGNQLFFNHKNGAQLGKTDGTTAGTLNLGQNFSSVKDMACANDYLYFLNGDSQKVWRSDGTASGTKPMDIFVTNDDNQLLTNENIQKLGTDGEKLFLTISTKEHGSELYEITDPLPVYLSTIETPKQGINTNVDVQIYPNPVSEYFSITIKGEEKIDTVKIFDRSGKLVKDIAGYNGKINISDLLSEVYFVKIKTGKGNYVGKIIKK